MDVDRSPLPTKEQFEQFCQQRVPRILAALQGSILQQHIYRAVSAEHMPSWVKEVLFGVLKPRPIAQRASEGRKTASDSQVKPRRSRKAE
jgi:hypothetical protein